MSKGNVLFKNLKESNPCLGFFDKKRVVQVMPVTGEKVMAHVVPGWP